MDKNIELTKNALNKLRAFINSEINVNEILDLELSERNLKIELTKNAQIVRNINFFFFNLC